MEGEVSVHAMQRSVITLTGNVAAHTPAVHQYVKQRADASRVVCPPDRQTRPRTLRARLRRQRSPGHLAQVTSPSAILRSPGLPGNPRGSAAGRSVRPTARSLERELQPINKTPDATPVRSRLG